MARQPALGARSDNRLYSRIARRCVSLLKHVKKGRRFEMMEVAREVHEDENLEFLRTVNGKKIPINPERIRDYLGYLHILELIVQEEGKYTLLPDFDKPSTDAQWVQYLSDQARKNLAKSLGVGAAGVPTKLEGIRAGLHEVKRIPTIAAILGEVDIEGAREEEAFRWSLSLYTEGDASKLEIRQYPHLVTKS